MTTHIVEIRPSKERGGGDWMPLTRAPVTKRDADNLVTVIGPHWESRVVVDAKLSPSSREFADLECMVAIGRWHPQELAHHPDCKQPRDEEWTTRRLADTDRGILTSVEWLTQRSLQRAAFDLEDQTGHHVNVGTPIIHQGYCQGCGASARHLSIKVEINGHVREYQL